MKLAAAPTDAFGIDISAANGVIDFAKLVAGGVSFVSIQITNGLSTDRNGVANLKKAQAAGLLVGAYHFSSYKNTAIVEAQHFASVIRSSGVVLDFPPMFDFEHVDDKTMLSPLPAKETVKYALDFADEMARQQFPVLEIYSYPSYLLPLHLEIVSQGLAQKTRLWIADYSKGPHPSPGSVPVVFDPKNRWYLPDTWGTWSRWQTHGNDDKGAATGDPVHAPRIPGVQWAVDHDYYNGTKEEMRAEGNGQLSGPPPAPASPPSPAPDLPITPDPNPATNPVTQPATIAVVVAVLAALGAFGHWVWNHLR